MTVDPACLICSAREHSTMTCPGMCAVLDICLAVGDVVKAVVHSFALQLSSMAFRVVLCFGNSVASTRFLLQDEFNIQTTQCDNCIIGFMFCLQQIACIFSIVAMIVGSEEISEASQILSCLSDMVYCTVCACMQTQHKIEMDKRDGKFGPQPMTVPPMQQMSRLDQPYPSTVGYPPPAYGQPTYPPPVHGQHNYPPPQGAGYPPPSGYPPAGYPPAGYQR
ncbi:hypothetical protein SASPL_148853 [Salvia splendens]|uniref:PLAC8 family protein n=1 Tax=Salvia splendens TaxID=180675 RepID=A0A8X8WBG0_SALSN|nr:hypothetical protein SASPL_148853 [Salvia splendens]